MTGVGGAGGGAIGAATGTATAFGFTGVVGVDTGVAMPNGVWLLPEADDDL